MEFYDRYARICDKKGIEPVSQRAAEMFGVTRATISKWKTNNKIPVGETVKVIADILGVSADYLLGRTDDPTDYTNPDLVAELAGPVMDEFDGDAAKTLAFQTAVAADAKRERMKRPRAYDLYDRLDDMDKARVESYMDGILTASKYASQDEIKGATIA